MCLGSSNCDIFFKINLCTITFNYPAHAVYPEREFFTKKLEYFSRVLLFNNYADYL